MVTTKRKRRKLVYCVYWRTTELGGRLIFEIATWRAGCGSRVGTLTGDARTLMEGHYDGDTPLFAVLDRLQDCPEECEGLDEETVREAAVWLWRAVEDVREGQLRWSDRKADNSNG